MYCLETAGKNEKIRRLLAESMKSWRVELIRAEENLGEVNIKRVIFQGDSLPPLLFDVRLYHLHISQEMLHQDIILQAMDKKLTIYFLWMT